MDGASPANRQNINNSNAIFYVSFGVCLLLYLSTYLIGSNEVADQPVPFTEPHEQPARVDEQAAVEILPKKRKIIILPPATPVAFRLTHVLPEVIDDYLISQCGCFPADVDNEEKHKLPPPRGSSNKLHEPKSAMVVYVAVGLLLMSLGATLVDFCKAKSESKKDNDNHNSRKKPALTRRCSLADLTVLRHTRKELLRKESFCGVASNHHAGSDQHNGSRNWKITRPPLRLD